MSATDRFDLVSGVLDEVEEKLDAKIRELELKIAELSGGLDVLRTGKSMRIRGTFDEAAEYKQFDIVAVNGSSFIATEDKPGRQCPGNGWQLLASAGRRGERGIAGPRGAQGARGERGESVAAAGFKAFHIDRKNYTLSIITGDGKIHAISLRGLFEQFVAEVRGDR